MCVGEMVPGLRRGRRAVAFCLLVSTSSLSPLEVYMMKGKDVTHFCQSPLGQDPLTRRLHAPSVPQQVPLYISPPQLREHGRNHLDFLWWDSSAVVWG